MVKIYLSKCIFLSETGDCLDGAIVTDGGNIAFVGDRQEALQEFPEGKVIDLGNRTVTAGLIETHSHIYAGGRFEQLVSLCVDPAEAEDVIMQKMKDFVETTPIEKDRIYLIYNYDFASAKKITRYGLDEMFGKETPVILADISLHGGAFSSKHWNFWAIKMVISFRRKQKYSMRKMARSDILWRDFSGRCSPTLFLLTTEWETGRSSTRQLIPCRTFLQGTDTQRWWI